MNKRSRRACNFCKEKKKRCDGKEPICGRCAERNLNTCTYSHHLDRRRPFSKAYVDSLTQQIKTYKVELQKLKSRLSQEQPIDTQPIMKGVEDVEPSNLLEPQVAEPDDKRELSPDYLGGRIDRFGKFHISGKSSVSFFGPRSIMSFVEHGCTTQLTNKISERPQTELSLSHLEKLFIDLYFSFQNALFIFVWRSLFEREMNLPPYSRNSEFFSEGLLKAILAVGSFFYHNSAEIFSPNGDEYAAMAAQCLQMELKSPALTTVQIAGILAIFYVYKAEDELVWYYCGIAVTASQTLGLNMEDEVLRDCIADYETYKEVRKIVFWGTYFLDRALNTMLGRARLLKSSSITCTVPSGSGLREFAIWKDPTIFTDSTSSEESRFYREYSQISFTTELFILTEKPLDELYLFFKPSDPGGVALTVAKATTSLIDFEASLPYFMRLNFIFSKKAKSQVCPGLFSFQIRLHYIHILLNRVFFIRNQHIDAQFFKETKDYQDHCYRCAATISDLVSRLGEIFGFSRVDAFLPDMICSAAILLLFLIQCFDSIKESEERDYKEKCISHYLNLRSCLVKCSENNMWARKAMKVLEYLEAKEK